MLKYTIMVLFWFTNVLKITLYVHYTCIFCNNYPNGFHYLEVYKL